MKNYEKFTKKQLIEEINLLNTILSDSTERSTKSIRLLTQRVESQTEEILAMKNDNKTKNVIIDSLTKQNIDNLKIINHLTNEASK